MTPLLNYSLFSDIIEILISLAIIGCNCYGAYIMTKVYNGLYFENYVLFSGILEMIFLIMEHIFKNGLFLLIIQALQLIITLYVSKRFLKLFLILSKKKDKAQIYNTYFIVLVVINGVFMLVSFIFYFINGNDHTVDDYITYAHDTFSAIVSVLLFLFALKIISLINWKLGEVRRRFSSDDVVVHEEKKKEERKVEVKKEEVKAEEVKVEETKEEEVKEECKAEEGKTEEGKAEEVKAEENKEEKKEEEVKVEEVKVEVKEEKKDEKKEEEEEEIEENDFVIKDDNEPMEVAVGHEIYLKKRNIQLLFVALANLITDCLEFLVFTAKLLLFRNSYAENSLTYPTDNIAYTLITIEHLCLNVSTFMNFIIFFWLIRECYEVSIIPNIKKAFLDRDITRTQAEQETENIKISNFLGDE
jgi:flagellar biosynthesis GTPase FlhF